MARGFGAACGASGGVRGSRGVRSELVARKATEALTAWANAQGAVWEFWLGSLQPFGAARQLNAWSRVNDTVGDAVSVSAKAVLDTQADGVRACAERIAADPRSSKLVVEGAHQAYDLAVAFSEATAQTCDAMLAALRCCTDPVRDPNSVPTERR